jgi:hypothetical protein
MNRLLTAVRIQLVGWQMIVMPCVILATTFLLNLAIFTLIGKDIPGGPKTGGALASAYLVLLIQSGVLMTQQFPYALGLSLTRRTFYAATALLLAAQALVYGVLFYLLKLVEDGTAGWGISMKFFGLPFLVQDNPVFQILIYAVPFLVLGFIGVFAGAVFKRWGLNAVFALGVVTAAVLGAVVTLVTWQRWWPAIGEWLVDQSPVSLFAGWPALLAVALAGAGYLTLRRATP